MIETIVQVDGMMCGMCESHINDAVRSHFQVTTFGNPIFFTFYSSSTFAPAP